jgi:hypothetical protein
MTWTFSPRWKEELVCSSAKGTLVLEMPMGVPTVYLPTADVWEVVAPGWARESYEELALELRLWCSRVGIPLVVHFSAAVDDSRVTSYP